MVDDAPDEGLSALGRHGAVYALGNVLSRLGGFVLLPLYLRVLSPEEYGVLEMFYAASAIIAMFVSGGLSQGALRFYYEYREESDRRAVITTALAAAGVLSGGAVLLLWPFSERAARMLAGAPNYATSFQLMLLTLVVQLTSEVGLSYFRIRNYSGKFVAASLGKLLLQVAINVITVGKLGWGVPGVLLGNLIGAAASGVVVLAITFAQCGWAYRRDQLLEMLRYTYPMVLAGIVGVVLQRSDRFILQYASGLDAVGLYALGDKLSMIFLIGFLEPFRTAYGAYRFSIIDSPARGLIQRRVLRYYVVGACFVALAVILPAPAVLRLFSNEAYWGATVVLPVLVFRYVLGGTDYVFQSGILFAKKTRYGMLISVLTGVLRVVIMILLVDRMGLMAPAYAAFASAAVAAVMTARVSRDFDPVDWDLWQIGKVALIVLACLWVAQALHGSLLVAAGLLAAYGLACVATRVVSTAEVRQGVSALAAPWSAVRRGWASLRGR